MRLLIGLKDLNLRPSAPKVLNSHIAAQKFKGESNFLINSARFVMTNKVIFYAIYPQNISKGKFN